VLLLGLATLLTALLAYGNFVAYRAVRAPVVVAVNVVLGAGLVAGARGLGISWHALGLEPAGLPTGLWWGAALSAVVVVGGALVYVTPLRRSLADIRAVRMVPREMAFHYLVRIPFGTALIEEVVFRGVLLAVLSLTYPGSTAILASSVAFGLWHVGASLDFLRANRPDAGTRTKVVAALTGVVVTTAGGIAFAVLRIAAESLLAPVLAHAAFNVVGLTLARSGSRGPVVP